jgi:predicted nuclease of predicted toxin-antitoxin system
MRIVFDENVPDCISIALTALASIAFPDKLEITSVKLLGIDGKPDEDVLHAVGQNGILITYDKDFKKQRALAHIIKQYKIGVFWVRQPKVKTVWMLAQLMVAQWDKILEKANTLERPFLCEVTKNGVSELFFG